MDNVMYGYSREQHVSDAWLAHLPLFLRLVQMQELMHYAQYLDEPDERSRLGCATRSAVSKSTFLTWALIWSSTPKTL